MCDSDDIFDNVLLLRNIHDNDVHVNDGNVHHDEDVDENEDKDEDEDEDACDFQHAQKKRKPSSSQQNSKASSTFQKKPSKIVEIDGLRVSSMYMYDNDVGKKFMK